jgi:trimethylamine--corrinoid protein Co-methyltransferase
MPFRQLRNPLPPLEIISPDQVEQLHQASMHILENVGLDFLDTEALDIWQNAGAKVNRAAQHVWLDRGLVLEAVAKAPSSFTWRARNFECSVIVGKNFVNFMPQAGMAYAANLDTGRRHGTLADFDNFLKLTHMCNALHCGGVQHVEPQDVPISLRHLKRLYSSFTLTDKTVQQAVHGRIITTDAINIARIIFGDDLGSQPVLGGVINASSPLRYDERMAGGLITYARAGQVTIITPFILAGAMSPITIAAALAQQNAEALAGVALTQLVKPGAPVVYGGFTTNIDMKSGGPAFGTPEGAWALLAGAQMARYYHLPYRGSGSLNTSKLPDAQAAYETMWTIWPAVLAHTNVIQHAVGWLDGGLTASYEKFIIDVEGLAMFHHFLDGLVSNHESRLTETRVDEQYGLKSALQTRPSPEYYQPFLSDRQDYAAWLAAGGQDTAQRANTIWKALLAQYQPPPLDSGIKEALQDYIARREGELAGQSLYD